MNLNGIKVNHASLEHAASEMESTVTKIDQRMNHLEHELENLKGEDWSGGAQVAYTHAKQKWDTAIHEMRELLKSTHISVSQSNDEYMAADKRGAASFEL